MKEKSYSEKLKSPKWQKKRLEIMKRDKFTCKLCGDTETQLHVHHLEYQKDCDPWEYENKSLVTLCEDCHSMVEEAKQEGANFADIKILKCNYWGSGHKISFCYYNQICKLYITDENNNFIDGFLMTNWIILEMLKFLKSISHGS